MNMCLESNHKIINCVQKQHQVTNYTQKWKKNCEKEKGENSKNTYRLIFQLRIMMICTQIQLLICLFPQISAPSLVNTASAEKMSPKRPFAKLIGHFPQMFTSQCSTKIYWLAYAREDHRLLQRIYQ
ncbi:hypothetical protein DM860_001593 [Cuscuta australis]|uniref:Uncharacterized protein n=1 Tax=Cuscuta australis TaxID=267555 RepID=A0A328E8T1_9ASTE|nr:hypothetical protein DM860_001593 [Cuscuta australis]